jgi:hypothetical protein
MLSRGMNKHQPIRKGLKNQVRIGERKEKNKKPGVRIWIRPSQETRIATPRDVKIRNYDGLFKFITRWKFRRPEIVVV